MNGDGVVFILIPGSNLKFHLLSPHLLFLSPASSPQDHSSSDVEPFLEGVNPGPPYGHFLACFSSVCLQLLVLLGFVL